MTYLDAIKKLLNKAGDELTYPVNISFFFLNANYIQFGLDDKRDINEILKDEIKNSDHISIRWCQTK
jgi:transcriptional/translational regulatory protein YebC/TACO1